MKKRTTTSQSGIPMSYLMLLIGAFSVGAVAGSLWASADGTTTLLLTSRLLGGGGTPAIRMICFDLILLALVFAAAFVRKGAPMCALAFFLKGLLLSLTVTACVGVLGAPGWGAAFALAFGSGFLSVAALLLLSLQALQPVGKRLNRGKSHPDNVYYLTTLLCAAILGISELVYWYLAPPLARAAVALFT